MINSNKIKGRIAELGLTQNDVAKVLEMAQSSFNLKLNGKRPLTVDEVEILCDVLKIESSDIGTYFFDTKIA